MKTAQQYALDRMVTELKTAIASQEEAIKAQENDLEGMADGAVKEVLIAHKRYLEGQLSANRLALGELRVIIKM